MSALRSAFAVEGGRGFGHFGGERASAYGFYRNQILHNSSSGIETGLGKCGEGVLDDVHFAVGTVAAIGPNRNLTRSGCGNVTKIIVERESARRAAGTSAAAPRGCVRRGGKQAAPSAPVTVFSPHTS
jgi:hypothetical protein